MTLLEYQPQQPGGPSRRSPRRRVACSALIGLGGGVLNLICLAVAIGTGLLLPFFLASGPCVLALFVIDRPLHLRVHAPREVIWVLLVLASAAQYMAYGLLLNFRFPVRRAVLLLALLLHLASGVAVSLSGFH